MAPRDQNTDDRIGLVRSARIFSNVVSPPVIFALVALALALHARPGWEGLAWAAAYGFFVALTPILFVLWLLQTGRIAELHMSNTRERHLPYLTAVLAAAVVYGLVTLLDGPQILRCLAIFNMLTLALLGLINARWLISFHATAVAAAWLITMLVFGWMAGLPVLLFVVLVAAVRLYLKRHTPAQVAAGLALGLAAVWAVSQLGCFGA